MRAGLAHFVLLGCQPDGLAPKFLDERVKLPLAPRAIRLVPVAERRTPGLHNKGVERVEPSEIVPERA